MIPILKENMSRQCSEQVAQQITQHVLALVLQQEVGGVLHHNDVILMMSSLHHQQEMAGVFRKQLEGAITTTLDKYLGKRLAKDPNDRLLSIPLPSLSPPRLHECGEDLLVDVSEVLYNELAVFRLMQELKVATPTIYVIMMSL